MKTNPLRNKLALVAILGIIALFGIITYAATAFVLGVGTIAHSALFNGPATLTVRTLTIPAGEVGGWHYHPGAVYNVVTRGAVTVEDGCGQEEVFTVGQAFEKVDGRVHRAKNLGPEESFEYNTFIVPAGSPLSVSLPERRCGPPRNVSECQNGWINFTHPRTFNSQGDCIQWINAGQ
jgi:quercetin dioxygenase-like cupin family protein